MNQNNQFSVKFESPQMYQYMRNYDKENDFKPRPITSRSRSPYSAWQVVPPPVNVYPVKPIEPPISVTYYGDYSNQKPKDYRYQTPNVLNLKQQPSSNIKPEYTTKEPLLFTVHAKGLSTQSQLQLKRTSDLSATNTMAQLKKIIGVKKSPQDSSFCISQNRQSVISNISDQKNRSPIAMKPTFTHNKSFTHEIYYKEFQTRCKSPTHCEFSRRQESMHKVPSKNNSMLEDEVDLTYTPSVVTQRSNQIVTRRALGSPLEQPPLNVGKLLFNDHFQNSNKFEAFDTKRNLSFNQLLDKEQSIRRSNDANKTLDKKVAPFISDSGKKDDNEIQQMVETLKQNILRDLKEVSKRCVVPQYVEPAKYSSMTMLDRFESKFESRFESKFESKFDSKFESKFDSKFGEHGDSKLTGDSKYGDSKQDSKFGDTNRFSFNHTNQSLGSIRDSLPRFEKPPLKKIQSPEVVKQSFQKEGANLFKQLTTVLNNGKEFFHQIQRGKSEDQFNSPEEPKKATHKSNTPSFHQQMSINSISNFRPLPSPLQLSFNISDIVSDQKQKPMDDEIDKLETTLKHSSSIKDDPEPEEEHIVSCQQSTPRYSEVNKDNKEEVTINNLSSITPDISLIPNKKLNVSLDSLLGNPIKETQRELLEKSQEHSEEIHPTEPDEQATKEEDQFQQEQYSAQQYSEQQYSEQQYSRDQCSASRDQYSREQEQDSHQVQSSSASRQERYHQLMKNFKEYRSQSNHQSQVKFDLPTIITPKAQSISEQAPPPPVDHISDFIIHSQGQRESTQLQKQESDILESVAIVTVMEQSQKLITFNENDSDVPPSVDRKLFSRRRHERPQCPSFREVLRERDRSTSRKESSHQSETICRKINFNSYSTLQENNSMKMDDSEIKTPKSPTQQQQSGISFLEYMKRKNI